MSKSKTVIGKDVYLDTKDDKIVSNFIDSGLNVRGPFKIHSERALEGGRITAWGVEDIDGNRTMANSDYFVDTPPPPRPAA